MHNPEERPRSIAKIKNEAKRMRRAARDEGAHLGVIESLNLAAQHYGFTNYPAARRVLPERDPALETPQ